MLSFPTTWIGVRHSSRVMPSLFSKSKDFNLLKIGFVVHHRLFYAQMPSYDNGNIPVGMPSEPLTPNHPHFHLFESNKIQDKTLTKKEIESLRLNIRAFQETQGDLSKDDFIFMLFQRLQSLTNDFQSLKNRVQQLETSQIRNNQNI
jgi:hypothetical protein